MEIKYDRGERVTLEAETAGIREKQGTHIRKERLSACFWQSLATTSLGK
jgi:hypothetical protein